MLPNGWDAVLTDALRDQSWADLGEFVEQERSAWPVYPPEADVFRAFELTSLAEVRVVVLGQDPYHRAGQAHGLAFSIANGEISPSLRKVRQELERDPAVSPPESGNLEGWARQGVLLLNTVLTVRAGYPNSHRAHGWEKFTDAVIRAINDKSECVVFLLWGAAAQRKAALITNDVHVIIRAAHPAARANALNPLVSSESFSLANAALVGSRQDPIEWDQPPLPSSAVQD